MQESPVGTRDEGSFEGQGGKEEFSGHSGKWSGSWKGSKAAFEATNTNRKQKNSSAFLLDVTLNLQTLVRCLGPDSELRLLGTVRARG